MFDGGSAYNIIKLKGYTSWAIGIMVSTLCNAILRNQRQLYTLSTNAQACHHHLDISHHSLVQFNNVSEKWWFITDCISTGGNAITFVHLFVRLSVCPFPYQHQPGKSLNVNAVGHINEVTVMYIEPV